ncbi:nucleoside hydrolase [Paenibacillus sinopodophylli]|uniref:nucleoside hydrolase n=1 Tax=Paenibacillus sinopodophylli TaxID=1837342 RepID=UPI00110CA6C6|nr:nucleoside hydrolase [Paenibacillus sinopodophylli]
MSTKNRLLLDVDTGIDDALAILYALLSPDVKVEGITTGFGNTDVDQATENTLRVIKAANCGYEVPVAKGAAGPLKRLFPGAVPHIHGHNGIGDAILPPSEVQALEESAAAFIVRKVNEAPGELTLVTVGRLTNLALALQLDPSIVSKFKQVVVMGGTVFAPGNITPVSEANLYGDPEAAAIVFESELPLLIVGLDVTQQTRLTKRHLSELSLVVPPSKRDVFNFMNSALQIYFDFYTLSNDFDGECPMHDPLAVIAAVHPSLLQTQSIHATIDCGVGYTAGMIITDRRVKAAVGRPINFCLEVDQEKAIEELLSVFIREDS